MRNQLNCSAWWVLSLLALLALPAQATEPVVLGWIELKGDARYQRRQVEERQRGRPWGRPYEGAEVALEEMRFPLSTLGLALKARRARVDAQDVPKVYRLLYERGVRHFALDLPPELIDQFARLAGDDTLIFNVANEADVLRRAQCRANLLHVMPSQSMLTDALAQYLITSQWREVLLLHGPEAVDKTWLEAMQRSAQRFGLTVVDVREYTPSRDPRERRRNNIALLSGRADYDVAIVLEEQGNFAREMPYQLLLPRPVAGRAGLVPSAWHWAWERHGAPQLNRRFMDAHDRLMSGHDWAGWMTVKALGEAMKRTGGSDPASLRAYLLSDELVLDSFKGAAANFRPWNGQLRQPILLGSGEWVVARTPLEGFLHPKHRLDTLGQDEPESECQQ